MKRVGHRHFMTIIEVLISMALTMLAITALIYFYSQVDSLNNAVEKVQEESFHSRYFEGRLASILPKSLGETDPSKDFLFITTDGKPGLTKGGMPTLLFMFDNGIDLNPDFSNHVLGRLYVSEKGDLMLAMWPAPARWRSDQPVPMRKELLFENVEEMEFKFFIPPQKDKKRKLENEGWVEEWGQEYRRLPALISVHLTVIREGEKQKMTYLFPFANTTDIIKYEK